MTATNEPIRSRVPLGHIGRLLSHSAYDEAFLTYSDGYVVFDGDGLLSAFSSNFPQLYPPMMDDVRLGIGFRDFLRSLYTTKAIQNLPHVDNIDSWLDTQCQLLGKPNYSYYHHLHDGRSLELRCHRVSTGESLFIAFDVTTLHKQQDEIHTSQANFYSFAALACDWFWELDKNLCYRYHSTHRAPPSGIDTSAIIGQPRIASMEHRVVRDEAFEQHNKTLREHQPLDVTLTWLQDNDRKMYSRIKAEPRFTRHGVFTGYFGGGTDVTEQMLLKEQLERHARYDYITKLLTKRAFETALNEALSKCRTRKMQFSLCMMDLDKFKAVNDQSGHAAGDELLRQLGPVIKNHFGETAMIGRIGGDEFAAIIECSVDDAELRVSQFISILDNNPFRWRERSHHVSASAGVVQLDGSKTAAEMMSCADEACYIAKQSGRGRVVDFHHPDRIVTAQTEANAKAASEAASPTRSDNKMQPVVALVMDHLTDEKLALSKTIREKLKPAGIGCFTLIVEHSTAEVDHNHPDSNYLQSLAVDAVIAFASGTGIRLGLPEFRQVIKNFSHLPVVSLGAALDSVTTIATDNETSVRDIMTHLIDDVGRRQFAFLRSCDEDIDSIEREQVFRDVLAERGLPVIEERIVSGNICDAAAYRVVSDLIDYDRAIDAIVCCDDNTAIAAIRALHDHDLAVPDDVAVCGFDSGQHNHESRYAVTTARIDNDTLASTAAGRICSLLQQTSALTLPPVKIRIPAELIIRASTQTSPLIASDNSPDTAITHACGHIKDLLTRLQSTRDDRQTPLYDLFESACNQGNTAFVEQLQSMQISTHSDQHSTLRNLRTAIHQLFVAIGNTQSVPAGFTQLGLAVQQIDVLMNNYYNQKSLESQRSEMLQENFFQQLSSCRSVASLPGFIDSGFSKVGISTAFLVLYSNRRDLVGHHNTQLVYARENARRTADSDTNFAAEQILPQKYHASLCSKELVMLPLCTLDNHYGYLLVSHNDATPLQLRAISNCIATALHNINRIRDKEQHTNELREINGELAKRTMYDSTTGLPNRTRFITEFEQTISRSEDRSASFPLLIFSIDTNAIPDNPYQRQDTDSLLRALAIRLTENTGPTTTIARIGEHDFAIIAEGDIDAASQLAAQALKSINAPYPINGRQIRIKTNAGIAIYPTHGVTADELAANAYTALRHVTGSASSNTAIFNTAMNASVVNKWQLEQDMHQALLRGEFYLVYQPRVCTTSGRIESFEALMRWQKLDESGNPGESISPLTFIPIAEESGFIATLGRFALDQATLQIKVWQSLNLPTKVSVNLSSRELLQDDLVEQIQTTLQKHSVTAGSIEIEVTETSAMKDIQGSIKKLQALRDLGIDVAIDDFGTSYSSLNYLKQLPASHLKIDRSFIKDIKSADGPDSTDKAIVHAIVGLGHSLGFRVVAEGAETKEQWDYLVTLGCDEIQGYYFSPPVAAEPATVLLQQQTDTKKTA